MNLDNSLSCYLMYLITENIGDFLNYFILFLSISGAASVKTAKNQFWCE